MFLVKIKSMLLTELGKSGCPLWMLYEFTNWSFIVSFWFDRLYLFRYAFNIARSDYRSAGETMGTYCYNLASHVRDAEPSSRPLAALKTLRDQADICLASINAYSLIDEQLAFFKLQLVGAYAHQRAKRQADLSDSWSTGGQAKHFRSDASTMGWQVTAAPGSGPGAMPAQERTPAKRMSADGFMTWDAGDDRRGSAQQSIVVTLVMLRKHYALLR
jgi:hypothetical protein